MSAEERAMEWLDLMERNYGSATTIKALLARPRMPERPDEGALQAMRDSTDNGRMNAWSSYRALYQHLSAPKAKTVYVVRASWSRPEAKVRESDWPDRASAADIARSLLLEGAISVTITPEERPAQ